MFRKCKDVDLWSLDRGPKSCIHKTSFCKKHCYNKKLYKMYPDMKSRDRKNDLFWDTMDQETFQEFFNSRKKTVKRFRVCIRGESFSSIDDIVKFHHIIVNNPSVLFWIPTRAWRNDSFRIILEKTIMNLPNARLMASIDPSNTEQEISSLIEKGWSTMYFGDNDQTENRYKCPKTWNKIKKACSTCKNGCFSKKQVHVHLKKH